MKSKLYSKGRRKAMFLSLLSAGLVTGSMQTATAQTAWQWAFKTSNTDPQGAGGGNYPAAIVKDATGNTYITGYFQRTSDFDPGPGTLDLTSAGDYDLYFAKYTSAGALVFAKRIGGAGAEIGKGIAVDASGNIYLTGTTNGSADFDPGAGVQTLTAIASSGGTNVFVAKYDAAGNYVYANLIASNSSSKAGAVAVDDDGYLYATGGISGFTDLDPGPGVTPLMPAGSMDMFIAKYAPGGSLLYLKPVGNYSATNTGNSIALDGYGKLSIVGATTGSIDFDPGPGNATVSTSSSSVDAFIARYDTAGNYLSGFAFGGSNADEARAVAYDGNGNSYVTGSFSSLSDFDPGPSFVPLNPAGDEDVFIAKYNPSGNLVYAKSIGGTGFDRAYGIAAASDGELYITGTFSGTVDFDPGAATHNLVVPFFDKDLFIAHYDGAGNYVKALSFGNIGDDQGSAIAVDVNGNYTAAGQFTGGVDFDPGPANATLSILAGSPNGFMATYDAAGSLVQAGQLGRYLQAPQMSKPYRVRTDATGNVYILGQFTGTVDFDFTSGVRSITGKGMDMYLAKYNRYGGLITVKTLESEGLTGPVDLQLDASGNIYIAGMLGPRIDFDPGPGVLNRGGMTPGGSFTDVFVAKYDPSMNVVYAHSFTTKNFTYEQPAIAADAAGNLYLSGWFAQAFDIDPGAGVQNLSPAGNRDMFLARFNATGGLDFAKRMSGANSGNMLGMYVDGSGNVIVGGSETGGSGTDFDPGPGNAQFGGNGTELFFAKYDASGNFLMAHAAASGFNTQVNGFTVDAAGNPYFTGTFRNNAEFGSFATPYSLNGTSNNNVFLVKYSSAGTVTWAKVVAEGNAGALDVMVNPTGSIYMTGNFSSSAAFDNGSGTQNLTAAGPSDLYLANYDAAGTFISLLPMGGTGQKTGAYLAAGSPDNIFVAGSFNGTAALGDGSPTMMVSSGNGTETYLAKFGSGIPLPVSLLSFEAKPAEQSATVQTRWATASQQGSSRFEVERSRDGQTFELAGGLPACGTCIGQKSYQWDDLKPLAGTSWYRLRMVDANGSYRYSQIARVTFASGGKVTARIYPTATTGTVNVSVQGSAQNAVVSVLDMTGDQVMRGELPVADGAAATSLDLSDLQPATYLVQIIGVDGSVIHTGKVVRK